jgi:hypothetical protein
VEIFAVLILTESAQKNVVKCALSGCVFMWMLFYLMSVVPVCPTECGSLEGVW